MPKDSTPRVSKRRTDPSDERVQSIQHHPPPNQTKVFGGKKTTRSAQNRLSHGSLFESSRNVTVGGGEFNSTQGHHADLTINLNQYAAIDCPEDEETEYQSNGRNSRVRPIMDNESDSTPSWNLTPLPVRRSCDIYYRHLVAKGRGSPLWEPEPSSTLPNGYRRQGISVGDVGIITASGGFDFMFNICLSSDHPINQEGLPEGFSPIVPQLKLSDIRRHMAYNPNSYLASESVAKSHRESDSSEIAFESSASEGAILTMPQGALAEDLANISQFRQYFSANAESWYRYINNIRGREAKNGDVRLVIGCDKASSWGMATFSNSTAQDFRLKFKPINESGSRGIYEWEYSAMVDARAGPDPEEMEQLRSTDYSRNLGAYKNQCLFLRTLNATLRDHVWKTLGLDFETAMDVQFDSYTNSYGPSSSTSSSTRSPNRAGQSSSNSTTGGSTRSSGIISLPWRTFSSVLIDGFDTALTAHPSKTINDFILAKSPRARVAITGDDDWTPLIIESDERLPPPDELINRMLTTHDICEADGIVFLQFKQKSQHTNAVILEKSGNEVNIHPISASPFRRFPNEVWATCFSFLHSHDLASVVRVCRCFHAEGQIYLYRSVKLSNESPNVQETIALLTTLPVGAYVREVALITTGSHTPAWFSPNIVQNWVGLLRLELSGIPFASQDIDLFRANLQEHCRELQTLVYRHDPSLDFPSGESGMLGERRGSRDHMLANISAKAKSLTHIIFAGSVPHSIDSAFDIFVKLRFPNLKSLELGTFAILSGSVPYATTTTSLTRFLVEHNTIEHLSMGKKLSRSGLFFHLDRSLITAEVLPKLQSFEGCSPTVTILALRGVRSNFSLTSLSLLANWENLDDMYTMVNTIKLSSVKVLSSVRDLTVKFFCVVEPTFLGKGVHAMSSSATRNSHRSCTDEMAGVFPNVVNFSGTFPAMSAYQLKCTVGKFHFLERISFPWYTLLVYMKPSEEKNYFAPVVKSLPFLKTVVAGKPRYTNLKDQVFTFVRNPNGELSEVLREESSAYGIFFQDVVNYSHLTAIDTPNGPLLLRR